MNAAWKWTRVGEQLLVEQILAEDVARCLGVHLRLDPAELLLFCHTVVTISLPVARETDLTKDSGEQHVRVRGVELLVDLLLLRRTILQSHLQCFGMPPAVLVHVGEQGVSDDLNECRDAQLHMVNHGLSRAVSFSEEARCGG